MRGQNINFYPTGSEPPFRENKRFAPPNIGSDEFPSKRQAMDSNPVNNILGGISPRFLINQYDSVDHNQQYVKPINPQSLENYQFYDMNNSFMSSQKRVENIQPTTVDGSKSYKTFYGDPSFVVKASSGGFLKLPDSQSLTYGIAGCSEASGLSPSYIQSDPTENSQSVFASYGGLDSRPGNNYLSNTQYPSQIMPSQSLTILGPPERMKNEDFNQDGRTFIQDISKSGQNLNFVKHSNFAANFGQASVNQYFNGEMRPISFAYNDILGANLNVRGTYMIQIPVPTESSAHKKASVDNGMLKSTSPVLNDLEAKTFKKEGGLNNDCSTEGAPPVCDSVLAGKKVDPIDGQSSQNMDEQMKPIAEKLSPVRFDKLWDGLLQLNTSTIVSAVAFFKSGEKVQDINWSELIEIKGKVRLSAFEKFIQELPRSRNRALMVISLCWKVGSSKAGFTGMKEVSKGYKETERVGFAHICPGFDLYVCPHSETIITILAKYGFFKGIAAVEVDHDSLIGCVVWRRNQPSSNPVPQKPEKKRAPLPEQLNISPESSSVETNSPCTRETDSVASHLITDTGPNDLSNLTKITADSNQSGYNLNIEIPSVEDAEQRNPDLGFEATRPVPPIKPSLMLPEPQQRNPESSKEMYSNGGFYSGNFTEVNPLITLNSLLQQVQSEAAKWTYPNSLQGPTCSTSKDEVPYFHNAEPKKPDTGFELRQPVLPGPPPLPPEIMQRVLQSNRDAHQGHMKGTPKDEIPIGRFTESKKAAMISEPTGSTLHRAPQPIEESWSDDDDLPEFNFHSACGTSEASARKFPRPDNRFPSTESPQLNNNLPVGTCENLGRHMSPSLPMLKPLEDTQRSQASSFRAELFSSYLGVGLPKNSGDFHSGGVEGKYSASRSSSVPSTIKSDNNSASTKTSCGNSRKINPNDDDDDDDDDMPEWCPPDLEHPHRYQSNTSNELPSPASIKRYTENPAMCQGLVHDCQPGLLGPHPAAFPQAISLPGSVRPPPKDPNPNHHWGPGINDVSMKPSFDANRRWQGP